MGEIIREVSCVEDEGKSKARKRDEWIIDLIVDKLIPFCNEYGSATIELILEEKTLFLTVQFLRRISYYLESPKTWYQLPKPYYLTVRTPSQLYGKWPEEGTSAARTIQLRLFKDNDGERLKKHKRLKKSVELIKNMTYNVKN